MERKSVATEAERIATAMARQQRDDGSWLDADIIGDAWEDTGLDMEVLVRMWRSEADRRNRLTKAEIVRAVFG